jgi:3-oxoacyl-[acyl-carrier-protein] synthase II
MSSAERAAPRRVVVTGIGLVTALGVGTEETWRGLLEGRSAVGPIRAFDASSLRSQLAAELDGFDPEQFAQRKTLRTMTRNDQLAAAGASLAAADAGLEAVEDGERAGLFVASGKEISNLGPILEGFYAARNDDGSVDAGRLGAQASSVLHPLFYVEGLQAASLFYVSAAYGLKGANTYFTGGAEAGAHAIGSAFRAIRRGEVDVAFAGGFDDACSIWGMTKLDALGVLTDANGLGEKAYMPYDRRRRGAVLGEGAALLVLEEAGRAAARGVRVYAELAGYGSRNDTGRLFTPDPAGEGLAQAIGAALAEAGADPADVAYVAADGAGTRAGDASEAAGIRAAFDGRSDLLASSVKPATGHLAGGAGALNVAVAALATAEGAVPPTLNLEQLDPACTGPDWVARERRSADIGLAVALARGFTGQSVAIALRAAA